MNVSKKFLPASLVALLIAGVLTGCPSQENTPADQALKAALNKFTDESYNFSGYMVANIKEDENALIGTKGGLSEEQAEEELDLVEQLKSTDGQNTLNIIRNGKIAITGAVDGKNMKYETLFTVNYELNGMKAALEIPTLLNLKDEPALYVDPKAGKAFNLVPPQVGTKLIRLSVDDIPGLSKEDKTKFKSMGPLVNKYTKIFYSSFEKMDAGMFKDIDVSADAKQAGAVRLIQTTMTPEQNDKISKETMSKVLAEAQKDFNLSQEQIAEMQEAIDESNNESKAFMGNTVANYGLNDKGQIVYMAYTQSFKGAKHVGDIQFVSTMKDYDKPTFVIDPAKQGTVSVLELMMSMR